MSDLPTVAGGYRCILADPPWRFATWSRTRQTRAAENHYAIMSLGEVMALPVAGIAAEDAILFLWATDPLLPQALATMDAWGFAYKTVAFTWAKTRGSGWHMGLGYWTRANPEQCLLGTRGKPVRRDCGVRQLVVAPLREHSRKPGEVHAGIERLCDGPRLELFARQQRPGWDCWGNETGKFGVAA